LTPALALLLVHDQLLSKRGVVAPASHSLKVAVARHKARLNAEFTKARLRRGFASIEALRAHLNTGQGNATPSLGDGEAGVEAASGKDHIKWAHPRWVRVNTIRSSLEAQLATTFADYVQVKRIEELLDGRSDSLDLKVLHVDRHIPNLLALPAAADLSATPAYRKGEIILQDKASCFPAYLLDPGDSDRDIIDACAAPGNKTTHIAALLQRSRSTSDKPRIVACEKDKSRALTLQKMVDWAGAEKAVEVKAGQDFLKLDPEDAAYKHVGVLLLDPSCSGSGIVGREDMPRVVLPSADAGMDIPKNKNKRKRSNPNIPLKSMPAPKEEVPMDGSNSEKLQARLSALSTFQSKLIKHAFLFPSARKITYSTCSIHAEENEHVVIEALRCAEAKRRGWRILSRSEQVPGMREWAVRGDRAACERLMEGKTEEIDVIAEGCIRCEKGTQERTMGFFVVCFVRDGTARPDVDTEASVADDVNGSVDHNHNDSDSEWQGFDGEDNLSSNPLRAVDAITPNGGDLSRRRKKSKRTTKLNGSRDAHALLQL